MLHGFGLQNKIYIRKDFRKKNWQEHLGEQYNIGTFMYSIVSVPINIKVKRLIRTQLIRSFFEIFARFLSFHV